MGPKGVEPSPTRRPTLRVGARSPYSCQLHHSPAFSVAAMRFNRSSGSMLLSFRVVVVSGSPEDRTQRDPRIRRIWATSPRLPLSFQKSDTSESNREPSAPKADVLPSAPVSDVVLLPSPQQLLSAHIFLVSGPGGAQILVCGSSDRR